MLRQKVVDVVVNYHLIDLDGFKTKQAGGCGDPGFGLVEFELGRMR